MISTYWDFAWDYKAYPAFFLYPRNGKTESRLIRGEIMKGEPVSSEESTVWQEIDGRELTVECEGMEPLKVPLPSTGAPIDLNGLAGDLRFDETLSFSITAMSPEGPLSENFSFPVSAVRKKRPPQIGCIVPTDGAVLSEDTLRLEVEVVGDVRLEGVEVVVNESQKLVFDERGEGDTAYKWLLKETVPLRSGSNTIQITASDKDDTKTVKTLTITRSDAE